MPKVTHSLSEAHPVGWHRFCVRSSELVTNDKFKKGEPRVKFTVESSEKKSDGSRHHLTVFTGTVVSDHPNCKLTQLIEACGVDTEGFDNTDDLDGSIFAGKVEEGENGYANIVAFDTKDRVRPAGKAERKSKKAEGNDPFEEE